MAEIKIRKSNLYLLIALILIILIAVFIVKSQNTSGADPVEVQAYKTALFESIYCQYNCPLEYITFNNQTQILPSQQCVQSCISKINEKGYEKTKYSDSDLLREDNMVLEVTSSIEFCGDQYPVDYTSELLNNTLFVDCVKSSLNDIKSNYTYLN